MGRPKEESKENNNPVTAFDPEALYRMELERVISGRRPEFFGALRDTPLENVYPESALTKVRPLIKTGKWVFQKKPLHLVDRGVGAFSEWLMRRLQRDEDRVNRKADGEYPVGYAHPIYGIFPVDKYGFLGSNIKEKKQEGGKTGDNNTYVEKPEKKEVKYIGGSTEKTRSIYINLDNKLQRVVHNTAKDYGLNPNLLMSVLSSEGVIDDGIMLYNKNKGNVESIVDVPELASNLFENFGLDDIYSNYINGIAKTNRPIKMHEVIETNEKGREVRSAGVDSVYDAIELMASDLRSRRDRVRKDFGDIPEDLLDSYTHAYYNRGNAGGKKYIKNKGSMKKYEIPSYIRDIDYSSNPLMDVAGVDYETIPPFGMRSPFPERKTYSISTDDYHNPNLDIDFRFNPDSDEGYTYRVKEKMEKGGSTGSTEDRQADSSMAIYDEIYDYLTEKKDIPKVQAIGILSNLAAESGGNISALGAAGDFGIQQWLGPRKTEIQRRYGKKPTLHQQLDYLVDEYRGNVKGLGWNFTDKGKFYGKDKQGNEYNYYMYSKSDFDNATNYKDATIAWNQGFGRPLGSTLRNEKRMEFSDVFAKRYGMDMVEAPTYSFGTTSENSNGDIIVSNTAPKRTGSPVPSPKGSYGFDEMYDDYLTGEDGDMATGAGRTWQASPDPSNPSLAPRMTTDDWWESEGKEMVDQLIRSSASNANEIRALKGSMMADRKSVEEIEEEKRIAKEEAKRQAIAELLPGLRLNIKGMSAQQS